MFGLGKKKASPSGAESWGSTAPIQFNSVDFRDGQQSLLATRMCTEDMLPVLPQMDSIGYTYLEVWGGATFDVCIRYLDEDPWDRLRAFRRVVKHTPLKMVLRGQNLVGYRPYADDIVERFVRHAAEVGIDCFMIFDALQDLRNCETAFRAALAAGKQVEGSLQYTISPIHNIPLYVDNAREQERMGATSIHVEDMAGQMTPTVAYNLIAALKTALRIPVHLHCHSAGDMAEMCYWEAMRAGVDGLDVCVSALSMGTSLPPVESMIIAAKDTPRDSGLDVTPFLAINDYFAGVREKYRAFQSERIGVDVGCLQHQIPGGMLTNLENQLRGLGAVDRLPEILEEAARVRCDLGYPPLATPSSQMVGAQATSNVLTGEPYKLISKEVRDYIRGLYGTPPGPIRPDLVTRVLGSNAPQSADLTTPMYAQIAEEAGALAKSEEDVLTYAMFPTIAADFLRRKYGIVS